MRPTLDDYLKMEPEARRLVDEWMTDSGLGGMRLISVEIEDGVCRVEHRPDEYDENGRPVTRRIPVPFHAPWPFPARMPVERPTP